MPDRASPSVQAFYLQEVNIPDWNAVYGNPANPVHFDIGFGKVRRRP